MAHITPPSQLTPNEQSHTQNHNTNIPKITKQEKTKQPQ